MRAKRAEKFLPYFCFIYIHLKANNNKIQWIMSNIAYLQPKIVDNMQGTFQVACTIMLKTGDTFAILCTFRKKTGYILAPPCNRVKITLPLSGTIVDGIIGFNNWNIMWKLGSLILRKNAFGLTCWCIVFINCCSFFS